MSGRAGHSRHIDAAIAKDVLIKCVVVGATGVGKTRLIISHACSTRFSLQELLVPHVSTVWAIDHYSRSKEIFDKSWCIIDGVRVSIQIWDTFGDQYKDRRFAYGKADVAVLCFSCINRRSLAEVESYWMPEINEYCPGIPVILVGCKIDMRYIYDSDAVLQLYKAKGPLLKKSNKEDIISKNEGRFVAERIGATYYECSVLYAYGVSDVFENAARAALLSRRDSQFLLLSTAYRNIRLPLLQKPFLPPKPPEPQCNVEPSQLDDPANTFNAYTNSLFDKNDQHINTVGGCGVTVIQINHPLMRQMIVEANKPIIIILHNMVSSRVLDSCMRFMYTGKVATLNNAEFAFFVLALKSLDLYSFSRNRCLFLKYRGERMIRSFGVDRTIYTDVKFVLMNGEEVYCHKSMLMARNDVMNAMLNSDFKERASDRISIEDVSKSCFLLLLRYLYTDQCPELVGTSLAMELIILANRFCLPRLVNLVEEWIITSLHSISDCDDASVDLYSTLLTLLEPSKLHNADQLFAWCQHTLTTQYKQVCSTVGRQVKKLNPHTQVYLNINQWPPIWYVEELWEYEKGILQQDRDETKRRKKGISFTRSSSTHSGLTGKCLCFRHVRH